LEQIYITFLPKGGHPFIYISLLIEPNRVDVNIHPTKREVGFLNEEEVIEKVCAAVQKRLGEGDSSRRFTVQTLLPGAKPIETTSVDDKGFASVWLIAGKKAYSNYLVRTDPQTRKITTMFPTQTNAMQGDLPEIPPEEDYEITEKEHMPIKLASIRELREEVMEVAHNGSSPTQYINLIPELTELFANHTFVGIVDSWRRLAAIQHGVKLYLVDYGAVSYEFFYQLGLSEFGNFGTIEFADGLNLRELLELSMEISQDDGMTQQSQMDEIEVLPYKH
jgi:DNA mismatch repair protein MLH1